MKKFFLCLLILALFGAFVFYVGWTQIKLKPQTFGIVVSKLNGISDDIAMNGKVSFHKEFLLPTNAVLVPFSTEPFFLENTVEGALPSSDFYSNGSVNFDYKFVFQMEIHVNPEDVLALMKKNLVSDQDSLNKYIQSSAQSIAQDSAALYLKKASENPGFIPESIGIVELYKACRFYEKYPDISIDSLTLKNSRLPDYQLYKLSKSKIIESSSNLIELNNTQEKIEEENINEIPLEEQK